MKRLLLSMMMLIVCGCSILSNKSNQPSNPLNSGRASSTSEGCPEKPEVVLDTQNVKSITLSEQKITESGIANKTKSQGYSFEAQAGQKLNYQTNQDICIWIYTPDNQLLGSGILPTTGKYILQVSALKGSTTFDLAMGLETVQKASASPVPSEPDVPSQLKSTSPSPTTPPTLANQIQSNNPNINNISRSSPEEAIQDYYSNLNNRHYQNAWNKLSDQLRNNKDVHPNGYVSFTDWWNKVNFVEIQETRSVEQGTELAIVDTKIKYQMKSGREAPQSLRIFLIWNAADNRWNIDKAKIN